MTSENTQSNSNLINDSERESLTRLCDVLTEAELSSDQFIDSSLNDRMLITDLKLNDFTVLYFVFADVVEADFFLFRLKKSLQITTRFYSSDALEFILYRGMKRKISLRNLFRIKKHEIILA